MCWQKDEPNTPDKLQQTDVCKNTNDTAQYNKNVNPTSIQNITAHDQILMPEFSDLKP
jgi:hypothetical protein